jgi:hypothetical protein
VKFENRIFFSSLYSALLIVRDVEQTQILFFVKLFKVYFIKPFIDLVVIRTDNINYYYVEILYNFFFYSVKTNKF